MRGDGGFGLKLVGNHGRRAEVFDRPGPQAQAFQVPIAAVCYLVDGTVGHGNRVDIVLAGNRLKSNGNPGISSVRPNGIFVHGQHRTLLIGNLRWRGRGIHLRRGRGEILVSRRWGRCGGLRSPQHDCVANWGGLGRRTGGLRRAGGRGRPYHRRRDITGVITRCHDLRRSGGLIDPGQRRSWRCCRRARITSCCGGNRSGRTSRRRRTRRRGRHRRFRGIGGGIGDYDSASQGNSH